MHTVPFNQTLAEHTLATLAYMSVQFYVFLEIAKHPPPPFGDMGYDLIGSLRELGNNLRDFQSDYSFTEATMKVFARLHDRHMKYEPNPCYLNFHFFQPLPLVSYFKSDHLMKGPRQVVSVVPSVKRFADNVENAEVTKFYYRVLNYHGMDFLESLSNATVTAIEGIPALQYLSNFSSQLGVSKHLDARLMLVFARPFPTYNQIGAFSYRRAGISPLPQDTESTVTYKLTLANGTATSVVLPWLGVSSMSLTSSRDLTSQCHNRVIGFHHDEKSTRASDLFHQMPKKSTQTGWSLVLDGKYIKSYYSSILFAAAFWLPSFEPGKHSAKKDFMSELQKAVRVIVKIISQAKKKRNPASFQVLFDMVGNGGGNSKLAYDTARYFGLLGSSDADKLGFFACSYRDTVLQRCRTASFLFVSATNSSNTIHNPWEPGIMRQRGGSGFVHFSETVSFVPPQPFLNNRTALQDGLFLPRVVMLTRGLCGSSCALFVSHTRAFCPCRVRTVVMGGIGNASTLASPVSYIGGKQEFSWNLEKQVMQSCPTTITDRVPFARGEFAYSIAVRENYVDPTFRYAKDIPAQYVWTPADVHIPDTLATATDWSAAWSEALRTVKGVAKWKNC